MPTMLTLLGNVSKNYLQRFWWRATFALLSTLTFNLGATNANTVVCSRLRTGGGPVRATEMVIYNERNWRWTDSQNVEGRERTWAQGNVCKILSICDKRYNIKTKKNYTQINFLSQLRLLFSSRLHKPQEAWLLATTMWLLAKLPRRHILLRASCCWLAEKRPRSLLPIFMNHPQ